MFDWMGVISLNIISYAVLLIITAIGLSFIFGLLDVINVACGAFVALGAYLGYTIAGAMGYWLALFIVPVIGMVLGLLIGQTIIRPIIGWPTYSVLLTFGLALVVIEIIKIYWGLLGLPFSPPKELSVMIKIGDFSYPSYRIFLIAMGTFITLGLWYFLEKTNIGMIVRAGLENREMVMALGINITKVQVYIFAVGLAAASLGGLLSAPILGVQYEMAWEFMLASFVVVVLGGVGHLLGTVVSGIIISAVMNIVATVAPPMAKVAAFVLMFIALVLLPKGILGKGR
jgi:branched-chain amino acid transport system permease protein